MSEAKHTPGSWTQGLKGEHCRYNANTIYDKLGSSIAAVYGVPLHCTVEDIERSDNAEDREGMANARLIAAAPDLLAACKLALDCNPCGACEIALRKAIEKAEGKA